MKKFSAAGTLVAASAAVAVIGFGAPAIASASSAAHVTRPVLAGQVLTPISGLGHAVLQTAMANKCDGDGDSDDVGCGSASANKCDGDADSDDVGCGSASANKCDGDGDSDDVGCGSASANKCGGDADSDDVGCGAGNHGIRPHGYRHHPNVWTPASSPMATTAYGSGEHFHGLVRWVDGLKDSILGLL